jgi:hypothetical protein
MPISQLDSSQSDDNKAYQKIFFYHCFVTIIRKGLPSGNVGRMVKCNKLLCALEGQRFSAGSNMAFE